MGYKLTDFSQKQRSMMADSELGFKFAVDPDAKEKHDRVAERELHRLFEQWCNLNGVKIDHSRMDKPSTIKNGWPDFTCLRGRFGCCVEFKAEGGVLSEDQKKVHGELKEAGVPVITTTDVGEAIRFCKEMLGL